MKFEEGSIYFNKIIVLQSLDANGRKTGTEIYDDIISRRAWADPNLSTELVNIDNKKHLFYYLNKLKQDSSSYGILPFIHWEMHGFEDGLVLTSDESIYWEEILNALRDINIASKNNLFISVSTCFGGRIQFIIDITQPCPFRGFIGPMEVIGDNDLLNEAYRQHRWPRTAAKIDICSSFSPT